MSFRRALAKIVSSTYNSERKKRSNKYINSKKKKQLNKRFTFYRCSKVSRMLSVSYRLIVCAKNPDDEWAWLGKVTGIIACWELRGHVRHFIYEMRKNECVWGSRIITTKCITSSDCGVAKIESWTVKRDTQQRVLILKLHLIPNYCAVKFQYFSISIRDKCHIAT